MRYGTPWKIEREKYRLMANDEWKVWYAWYPVRFTDGTRAWLEYVEYNQAMKYNLPKYRPLVK